jgi:hypothetical protein
MKRIVLVILSIMVICLFAEVNHVFAQDQATEPVQETIPEKAEYVLPYPGILSDNPLYALKNLRDKIMEVLIADPGKKVEFFILQSDKDYSAGIFLQAKGKAALVAQTLSRGNAYSEKAIAIVSSQKQLERPVPVYTLDHLQKSLIKHQDVITGFVSTTVGDQKGVFETILTTVKKFTEEAGNIQ